MMRTPQAARLAAIRNRPTRYEVVAETPAGTYLLGYTCRLNRGLLLDLARTCGDVLVRLAGLTDRDELRYCRGRGWECAGKLRIGRTGRTQRDAILGGEYPAIG